MKTYVKYLLVFTLFANIAVAEINLESQQMLAGYTAFVRSADCYLKGSYGFEGLSGENCEVNGDLYLCCNVLLSQYPAKIEGYLYLYDKTGFLEYKELAEQFIDKLYKIYSSTKDKYGNGWLPTQDVVRKDGKIYWYTEGPSYSRDTGHPISYDQSNGKFMIDSAYSPDNFGLGLLETAKLIRKAEQEGRGKEAIISPDHRKKLTEIIEGILEFFHRDYMINRVKGNHYFRTTDVEPMNPKMPIPFPKFANEAADVIYSTLALNELGGNTSKYDISLSLFLEYYLSNRNDRDKDFRIYLLDNRILDLCEYFQKKNLRKDLVKDVYKLLTEKYKQGTTKAVLMLSPTNNYSSTPFLEIYRKLKLKDNYNLLFKDIWENNFDEEKGVLRKDGKDASAKVSASHVILCYAYMGWKDEMITDSEFITVYNKYYMFKGNSGATRDLTDWVSEVDDWDKRNPNWQVAPYDCYPEQVEAEAYVNGKAQGYSENRVKMSLDSKEMSKKENQIRNIYYQFVSPFTNHSEPLYYGITHAFDLLDTSKSKSISFEKTDEIESRTKISFKEPAIPKGMQCFGVVDVTEIYYKNKRAPIKEGYEITGVMYKDKIVPFKISHILDYKKPFSGENNAKLCFSVEAEGKGKDGEVIIIVKNRKNPYYVAGSEKNMKNSIKFSKPVKPVDLPFIEKTGQENNVDTRILPESYQWFEDNKDRTTINIIPEWKKWCLAYLAEKDKVTGKMESILKTYLGMVEKKNTEDRYFTADRVTALSRIYYIYEGDYKEQLGKEIEKYSLKILKNVTESISTDDKYIEESEALIRYGILFPEKQKAKECLESGIQSLNQYLESNINKDGFNVYKETLITAQKLIEIERLCLLNAVELPEDIYKTTEKILEFLMYCSNPDGMLSEVIDKNKTNIREWLYWGDRLFSRSDFRYVAFGGLFMENSFEPAKTSVSYPGSNIYVMRNNWNIRDRGKMSYMSIEEMQEDRSLNIIYYGNTLSVSGYTGELCKFTFLEKTRVEKYLSDNTRDYLKKGANEIIFVKPKYLIIKINENVSVKGDNLYKIDGRLKTRYQGLDISYKELRATKGKGELEIINITDKVAIYKTDKGFELNNGDLLIYFYADDFRKRQRKILTSGNLENKEDRTYNPQVTIKAIDETILLESLDELGKITIGGNSEVSVNSEIQKRSLINSLNNVKTK